MVCIRLHQPASDFIDPLINQRRNFRLQYVNSNFETDCGQTIASLDGKPKGLTNYTSLIAQRARIEGFVVWVIYCSDLCTSSYLDRLFQYGLCEAVPGRHESHR